MLGCLVISCCTCSATKIHEKPHGCLKITQRILRCRDYL
ncbi:hypothetical protein SL1157_1897 [Ruegeria lacuscaerulensis ITI-1157]|nr:hypothetical protein SL1157_1897 [Ruegeria lacuscaerulensis ITI-1157]